MPVHGFRGDFETAILTASLLALQCIQRQAEFFIAKEPFLPSSQSRKGRTTHIKKEESGPSKNTTKPPHLLITLVPFWPNLRADIGWLEKLMMCLRSELYIPPKILVDLLKSLAVIILPASGCWVTSSTSSPII